MAHHRLMSSREMPLRIAVTGATRDLYALVREACGLSAPGESTAGRIGYCGRDFRTYGYMRVSQAVDFYAALNAGRWASDQLADDLAFAGLGPTFEIGRMKRAYARALVLALTVATSPDVLVVEAAEEFDEAPALALLERCAVRAPRAIVVFSDTSLVQVQSKRASGTNSASDDVPLDSERAAPPNDGRFDLAIYGAIVSAADFAAQVRNDPSYFAPSGLVSPLRVSGIS